MMPKILLILLSTLFLFAGCQPLQVNNVRDRIQPSNVRDWKAEFAVLPFAEIEGNQVTVHNIRNCVYATENDFTLGHYDQTFDLDDLQSVDFIVVPFQAMPFLAHTMLSFQLANGEHIAISAEIRTEKAEDYSAFLGISNQFELTYVVASEQDLIRLRTKHRSADVYIYPTVATPEQTQKLFLSVMQRVNELAEKPEFYHTLANNCTTNIFNHVQEIQERQSATNILKYSWRILLPGFSDRYAYDNRLIRTNLSFEETKALALVNDLADIHFDDPDFSTKIRARRTAMLAR